EPPTSDISRPRALAFTSPLTAAFLGAARGGELNRSLNATRQRARSAASLPGEQGVARFPGLKERRVSRVSSVDASRCQQVAPKLTARSGASGDATKSQARSLHAQGPVEVLSARKLQ